jgi:hypothetical protein
VALLHFTYAIPYSTCKTAKPYVYWFLTASSCTIITQFIMIHKQSQQRVFDAGSMHVLQLLTIKLYGTEYSTTNSLVGILSRNLTPFQYIVPQGILLWNISQTEEPHRSALSAEHPLTRTASRPVVSQAANPSPV